MNIYLISQDVNNDYDTYDACVVVARTKDDARLMHPDTDWISSSRYSRTWVSRPEQVKVEFIGIADSKFTEPQFILSSFNAG